MEPIMQSTIFSNSQGKNSGMMLMQSVHMKTDYLHVFLPDS